MSPCANGVISKDVKVSWRDDLYIVKTIGLDTGTNTALATCISETFPQGTITLTLPVTLLTLPLNDAKNARRSPPEGNVHMYMMTTNSMHVYWAFQRSSTTCCESRRSAREERRLFLNSSSPRQQFVQHLEFLPAELPGGVFHQVQQSGATYFRMGPHSWRRMGSYPWGRFSALCVQNGCSRK